MKLCFPLLGIGLSLIGGGLQAAAVLRRPLRRFCRFTADKRPLRTPQRQSDSRSPHVSKQVDHGSGVSQRFLELTTERGPSAR